MSLVRFVPVLLLLLGAAGCATITASHDFDPTYPFSRLERYDWLPIPVRAGGNPLTVKRFKAAVDAELQSKGYRLSSTNPEFLIAVHTETQQKVDITDWGYTGGPYWGTRDIDVTSYTEGTVILDFIDTGTKQMFWRGVGQGAVDRQASTESRTNRINEAVTKILGPFPPGP